eukprot:PhM_4_TR10762/c0_g1_i1/m.5603
MLPPSRTQKIHIPYRFNKQNILTPQRQKYNFGYLFFFFLFSVFYTGKFTLQKRVYNAVSIIMCCCRTSFHRFMSKFDVSIAGTTWARTPRLFSARSMVSARSRCTASASASDTTFDIARSSPIAEPGTSSSRKSGMYWSNENASSNVSTGSVMILLPYRTLLNHTSAGWRRSVIMIRSFRSDCEITLCAEACVGFRSAMLSVRSSGLATTVMSFSNEAESTVALPLEVFDSTSPRHIRSCAATSTSLRSAGFAMVVLGSSKSPSSSSEASSGGEVVPYVESSLRHPNLSYHSKNSLFVSLDSLTCASSSSPSLLSLWATRVPSASNALNRKLERAQFLVTREPPKWLCRRKSRFVFLPRACAMSDGAMMSVSLTQSTAWAWRITTLARASQSTSARTSSKTMTGEPTEKSSAA